MTLFIFYWRYGHVIEFNYIFLGLLAKIK